MLGLAKCQFILHLFALILLPVRALSLPNVTRSLSHVKEQHAVPDHWICSGRAPEDHVLDLSITLKPSRFEELERQLYEVSDPSHDRYGKYLRLEEVNNLVKPRYSSHALVKGWLVNHGLEQIEFSKGLDWIRASMTVDVAEKLLDTEYYVYRRRFDDSILIRAPQWSLPLYLHEHVETVQPTTSFFTGDTNEDKPSSRKRRRQSTIVDRTDKPSSAKQPIEYFDGEPEKYIDLFDIPKDLTVAEACNATAAMSPLCLRTLYGFLNYTPQASNVNGMALVNFLGEFNNRSDIDLFLRLYRPDAAAHDAAYSFAMENVNGAINQQLKASPLQFEKGKGKEGNLDAEVMLGLGWPTPFLAYSVAGRPPFLPDAALPANSNEPFLIWLQYVLEQETLPPVISISYSESEQTVPRSYAERVCRGFAQLGARGVTVLVASGDYGVGRSGSCMSNDSTNSSRFLPSFPGSCPYVTTIGATKDIVPEVVAVDGENDFVTGGGFSNYFPRPSYQDQVVPAYVKSLGYTHEGFYNKNGRGYPDISAQGYHYISVWNGTREGRVFDGTSASAPTVAAVVALVNDALLADGKPPMGFLNPWLYSRGHEAFTDIFLGSNEGCNTTGFPAGRGWDAASGFGTPWFPSLRSLAMQSHFRSSRPWYYRLGWSG